MRRLKTGVRILLILTVINYALAAPMGVREVSEVRVDVVDVVGDGTAASQKRWKPWDQSSKNAPDWKNAPPSPGWSDVENRLDEESESQDSGSSTGSNSASVPSELRPSLTDDSPPSSSTQWSSDEYSPSWREGPTEEYSPSWTEGPTKEYSPSWTKGSTEEHSSSRTKWSSDDSPSWTKGPTEEQSSSRTKWSSDEYSPSWTKGPTEEQSSSRTKWSSDEYSPSWTKGSTEEHSSSRTKWSSDEYSPSWTKGSSPLSSSTKWSDEYSPSWSKGSADEYSPSWSKGTSWSTGDSHPPNPGPTEDHPLPAPSNPGSSTGAHQSTNDHPPPPNPGPQHPAAPESEDFFSKLLKGKFRIPRHISGSGAVHAAQRVGNH